MFKPIDLKYNNHANNQEKKISLSAPYKSGQSI